MAAAHRCVHAQEASLFASDDEDEGTAAAAGNGNGSAAAGEGREAGKEALDLALHVPARLLNNTAVLMYR
jgi:hypothetical protein